MTSGEVTSICKGLNAGRISGFCALRSKILSEVCAHRTSSSPPPVWLHVDDCPEDAGKVEPGVCGCGVADTDSDEDGTADCIGTFAGGRILLATGSVFSAVSFFCLDHVCIEVFVRWRFFFTALLYLASIATCCVAFTFASLRSALWLVCSFPRALLALILRYVSHDLCARSSVLVSTVSSAMFVRYPRE